VQVAILRRLEFEWAKSSLQGADPEDYERAQAVLEKHKTLFAVVKDIVGYWIGSKFGEPYIMVAVMEGRGKVVEGKIPDMLDGIKVYYLEGTPEFHQI
jgi:hypothetical protein